MSFYHLLGALIFLAIGLIELALLYRVVYPQLRWRYEKAKLTQSQGIDPNRIMTLFKVQSLIVLPALGLLLAEPIRQFVENRT